MKREKHRVIEILRPRQPWQYYHDLSDEISDADTTEDSAVGRTWTITRKRPPNTEVLELLGPIHDRRKARKAPTQGSI